MQVCSLWPITRLKHPSGRHRARERERERVSQPGFLIKSIQSFESESYTPPVFLLCIMFPFLAFKGVIDCSDLDIFCHCRVSKAELDQSKNNRRT